MGINTIFGIHQHTLSLREKRTELLSSNLVNADTPGYKAKDIDFASMVKQMQEEDGRMTTTNSKHIGHFNTINEFDIKYRIPLQPSLDGNTVETNVENAQFADNAMRYMATVRFIDGKVKGIIAALRGE